MRSFVAALLACAACPLATAAGPLVLTEPYLQNVKPDGITIMWETAEPVEATLTFTDSLSSVYRPIAAPVTHEDSGFGTTIHKSELTGLSPGRPHSFTVTIEDEQFEGQFRTAPASFRPFSFGVFADTQERNRGAYDDDPFEPTKAMMRHLAEQGVDFGVGVGDHASDGDSYEQTRLMYLDRVIKYLGRTAPVFIAWGNHDGLRDDVLRKFADMPSKDREGYTPGYGSYSFFYGDSYFVCIEYRTMQRDVRRWLPRELDRDEVRNARHRFLFVHVPPFCQLWIDGSEHLREHLVPLLEEHNFDVVFSGHTHAYERGHLNGVSYCITGGGSWLDFGEPVVKEWPHFVLGGNTPVGGFEYGLVNQVMVVKVDEDGWKAEMHAFKPSGEFIGVLDTFTRADAEAMMAQQQE